MAGAATLTVGSAFVIGTWAPRPKGATFGIVAFALNAEQDPHLLNDAWASKAGTTAVHTAYGDDLRLGELELQTGKAKDADARREGLAQTFQL